MRFGYGNSEVADPVLGNTRKISREWYKSYRVDLRQDFEGTNWALGSSIDYSELARTLGSTKLAFTVKVEVR